MTSYYGHMAAGCALFTNGTRTLYQVHVYHGTYLFFFLVLPNGTKKQLCPCMVHVYHGEQIGASHVTPYGGHNTDLVETSIGTVPDEEARQHPRQAGDSSWDALVGPQLP